MGRSDYAKHIPHTLYNVQCTRYHPSLFSKACKEVSPKPSYILLCDKENKNNQYFLFYFLSLSTVFRRSCVETVFVLQEKISIQDINHY